LIKRGDKVARISEVAKMAGVSPATVSRVMNGTARVNKEKTKRVLDAIKETGFKPNEIARSLYKKSSRIIGYIVPNLLNLFLIEIGRAIEDEAFQNGYKVIFCNSDEKPEKEVAYINMLTAMNADGIIISTIGNNPDEEMRSCVLPIVVLDKCGNASFTASVQADNYTGGRLAAEHLIACGCQHIVQMHGSQEFSNARRRFHGYSDVCKEHNIEPQYIESSYDYSSGIVRSRELLERFPKVDGILAVSDMVALSLYRVLHETGRRVPDDIMIVGYDNLELSSLMTPSLTTVAQPMEEIGRMSAKIIIDMVENNKLEQREVILPVSLKIRETTII
jgi:DNA-binding LacI/PurR family transcriptional regulator